MKNKGAFWLGVTASILIAVGGLWSVYETQAAVLDLHYGLRSKTSIADDISTFPLLAHSGILVVVGAMLAELLGACSSKESSKSMSNWPAWMVIGALSVLYHEFLGWELWSRSGWMKFGNDGPFNAPHRQNERVMM